MNQEPQQWLTDNLRLTFFSSQSVPSSVAKEWFSSFAGTDPVELVERPAFSECVVSGLDQTGASVQVQVSGLRIDLLVFATQPKSNTFPLNILGNSVDEFQSFASKCKVFASQANLGITRIALGIRSYFPANSGPDGYAVLKKHAPFASINPETMRDFQMQANVRGKSNVAGIDYINRVAKWANVGLHPSLGGAQVGNPVCFACTCELDINSPVENSSSLSAENITEALDMFADAGIRILAEGYHE